jgi:hypothetical protein
MKIRTVVTARFVAYVPLGWPTLERNTREVVPSNPSPEFLTCRLLLGRKAVVKWPALIPG